MKHPDKLYVGCPIQHARLFLAGKWQMGILWYLNNQTLRFSEIRNLLPDISDKSLMQELSFFVDKKIIERNKKDFPTTMIEYSLTEKGRSLIPIVVSIVEWGYFHLQDERISKEMYMTPLPDIKVIESNLADKDVKMFK